MAQALCVRKEISTRDISPMRYVFLCVNVVSFFTFAVSGVEISLDSKVKYLIVFQQIYLLIVDLHFTTEIF